jgi:hypothetical protein
MDYQKRLAHAAQYWLDSGVTVQEAADLWDVEAADLLEVVA